MLTARRAWLLAALAAMVVHCGCASGHYYQAVGDTGAQCLRGCEADRLECNSKQGANERRQHECWRAEVACANACPEVRYMAGEKPVVVYPQ